MTISSKKWKAPKCKIAPGHSNILHTVFMCHCGRDNLRPMKVNTFAVATDPEDGRKYIYQAIDKADKNHGQHNTTNSNEGQIYEIPGTFIFIS